MTFNLVKYGDLGLPRRTKVRLANGKDNYATVAFEPPRDINNAPRPFVTPQETLFKGLKDVEDTRVLPPQEHTTSDHILKGTIEKELSDFEQATKGRMSNAFDRDLSELWMTVRDKMNCPNLCLLARYVFAVPATSASSERLFSQASLASSDIRATTDSSYVEHLMFVKGVQKLRERMPAFFEDLF